MAVVWLCVHSEDGTVRECISKPCILIVCMQFYVFFSGMLVIRELLVLKKFLPSKFVLRFRSCGR